MSAKQEWAFVRDLATGEFSIQEYPFLESDQTKSSSRKVMIFPSRGDASQYAMNALRSKALAAEKDLELAISIHALRKSALDKANMELEKYRKLLEEG